jgi:hypothetical protein
LEFQTNTAAGGWIHSYSEPDAIVDTDWHHYAVTASKGTVKMYIDGEPVEVGGSVAPKFDDGDQGYIGARVDKWNEYFRGSFDEIAIFNIVLTDSDIKNIATAGLKAAIAVFAAGKLTAVWGAIK